jgi:hypothetical protein
MPLNRSQAPTSLPPGHLGDEVLYERHSSAVIHSFGLVFLTIIEQPLIFTFAGLVAYGASPVKDSGLARGIMGGAAASGVVCAVIQIFILRAMFALEHVKPVNMKVPRPAARDANERETTRNNFGLGKLQEANQDRAGEDVSVSTLNGLQSPGFVVSLAMYLLWLGGSYSRALLSAVVISAILESKFQLGCTISTPGLTFRASVRVLT